MSGDLQISLHNGILLVGDRAFPEPVLLASYLESIEDRRERFVAQREVISVLVNKQNQMEDYLGKVFDLFASDATVVTMGYNAEYATKLAEKVPQPEVDERSTTVPFE